jgi:hypothetical protein
MITQIHSIRTVYVNVTKYLNFSNNKVLRIFFTSLLSYAAIEVRDLETNRKLYIPFSVALEKLWKATAGFIASVRPFAWKNSSPTGRIFTKFDI